MAKATRVVKLNVPPVEKQEEEMPSKDDLIGMAKYLEEKDEPVEAAKFYERSIKTERLREFSYNRLMMIYRKQKDYVNELRIIDAGIKAYQDFYMPSAVGKNKSILALSKKLNVLIGLTDKKGHSLTDAEPIAKWKKRREIVLKKIKSSSKEKKSKK